MLLRYDYADIMIRLFSQIVQVLKLLKAFSSAYSYLMDTFLSPLSFFFIHKTLRET